MPVHDVEVKNFRTGRFDRRDLIGELRKIGRENARRDGNAVVGRYRLVSPN
jgi:hypothetical protein